MRRTVLEAAFALLLVGQNACGNPYQPGNQDPPTTTVPVEAVKLTPQVIVFPAVGESAQLFATVSPANATDKAIAWESTDSTVAAVDAFGRVTARAVGSGVLITVYTHDGHHQASVNVSVNP
jgi:uncharacterized protein YjdB